MAVTVKCPDSDRRVGSHELATQGREGEYYCYTCGCTFGICQKCGQQVYFGYTLETRHRRKVNLDGKIFHAECAGLE